jgi:hypothetical protein
MTDISSLNNRNRMRSAQAGRKLGQGMDSLGAGLGRLLGSMKRGGRVHKTGLYKLHRGERVVPKRRGRR